VSVKNRYRDCAFEHTAQSKKSTIKMTRDLMR
jgi:hypothetical protein